MTDLTPRWFKLRLSDEFEAVAASVSGASLDRSLESALLSPFAAEMSRRRSIDNVIQEVHTDDRLRVVVDPTGTVRDIYTIFAALHGGSGKKSVDLVVALAGCGKPIDLFTREEQAQSDPPPAPQRPSWVPSNGSRGAASVAVSPYATGTASRSTSLQPRTVYSAGVYHTTL